MAPTFTLSWVLRVLKSNLALQGVGWKMFSIRKRLKNTDILDLPIPRSTDRRRKWQPTPVFLPGESQGWGSLVGCTQSRTRLKRLSSSRPTDHPTGKLQVDNLSCTQSFQFFFSFFFFFFFQYFIDSRPKKCLRLNTFNMEDRETKTNRIKQPGRNR